MAESLGGAWWTRFAEWLTEVIMALLRDENSRRFLMGWAENAWYVVAAIVAVVLIVDGIVNGFFRRSYKWLRRLFAKGGAEDAKAAPAEPLPAARPEPRVDIEAFEREARLAGQGDLGQTVPRPLFTPQPFAAQETGPLPRPEALETDRAEEGREMYEETPVPSGTATEAQQEKEEQL